MRSRIMSAFVATAAAGAAATTLGLAAAGTASAAVTARAQPAAMGSTIGSTSSAGYEASGRDFRYISSTITIPDTSLLTAIYPQEYIQLSDGSLTQPTGGGNAYVRAGIESCVVAESLVPSFHCFTGTWVAYVETFNNSISGPYFTHAIPLTGVDQGDGVNFSIYYNEAGNELHFVVTPPSTSGPQYTAKTRAYGAIFDHAAALDDFTNSTGTPIPVPFFLHAFRINQFLQGAVTTEHGLRGSFVGPWTTSAVVATSNGLVPPSGAIRVSPSALWSDGLVANGAVRPYDAFGVWAR